MNYDVMIIGGGMVGAALASALKHTELRVALVDAMPSSLEDKRLIALNDASVCLFENCGIWPLLAPHAAPIKQVHVSRRGRFGITRIEASLLNLNALGYVVPAKYINVALENNLTDASNTDILKPAKLEALTQEANGVQLTINGQVHHAKWVIGADGSYSTVRTLLDIPTETLDYQQAALVTTTTLQREHDNIAYERFLNDGALAMLPLAGRKAGTIWTAASDVIADLMQLSEDDFLAALQKHFGYRLGRLQSIGERATYPLKMIKAKKQCVRHVCLIGNAAHTIHPVAAQGLNLALYEVAVLATAFMEKNMALIEKIDKPSFSLTLSHRLTGLFSSDIFLLNQTRQMGLIGLDLITGLKKRFATRAIGKSGYVPALLTRKVVARS